MISSINQLESRLKQGDIIILDGGTGTELERLGASMDHQSWCAVALRDHPDLIKEVHRSYINAGADVITANTFGTTKFALKNGKMDGMFTDWNRLAVKLAQEALDTIDPSKPVYIAGSVSTFGTSFGHYSDKEILQLTSWFEEQAHLLVESGVDVLLVETLSATSSVMIAAIGATSQFDIPVWVAVSCGRNRTTGTLFLGCEESSQSQTFYAEYEPLNESMDKIVSHGGFSALLMMHSQIETAQPAVQILSEAFKGGPVGAYPNAGYWERPNWIFTDQITPDNYVAKACTWIDAGAQIIGGCCGIGPEHIRALRQQICPR